MALDLSKLTPAPWELVLQDWQPPQLLAADKMSGLIGTGHTESAEAMLQFAALARNAFDVKVRRGWSEIRIDGLWMAVDDRGRPIDDTWLVQHPDRTPTMQRFWPYPYISLVEANKWYRENVEFVQRIEAGLDKADKIQDEQEKWLTDPEMGEHPDDLR